MAYEYGAMSGPHRLPPDDATPCRILSQMEHEVKTRVQGPGAGFSRRITAPSPRSFSSIR